MVGPGAGWLKAMASHVLPLFEQFPQKLTNFTRAEVGTILFLPAPTGQSQTKL